jgi:hypothetical protein
VNERKDMKEVGNVCSESDEVGNSDTEAKVGMVKTVNVRKKMRIVKMLKLKKKMGMVKRVRLIGETG